VAHRTQVVRILLSRIAFRFGIAEELLELAICFQPLGRGRLGLLVLWGTLGGYNMIYPQVI